MHPRLSLRRLTCLCSVLILAIVARAERAEVSLDHDWSFHYGETPGAELPSFDASSWKPVSVPHTWNAFDGEDGVKTKQAVLMKGDYARGSGWYRRTLAFDPSWKGREVYLQFDGANRRTDVFLNGRLVGTHFGGNARFRFDLTGLLHSDASNLLVVKVNNEDNDIIPHSADFTFCGGLYRDVKLLVTDKVQVETMDHASPGVFLKQAEVTAEKAKVEATVELANHETAPVTATVHVEILDAAGQVVQSAQAETGLVAGGATAVKLPIEILQPHLWNARADPYLYSAKVEVRVGDTLRDTITQPLGLRFFKVDPNEGFFLNGKHLDLHGVSRHQDRLDKGWALSPADEREDFGLIAEVGATAIRVAHYQQSPLWYQLADEKGIVLWSEVPFVDEALPSAFYFNNALEQMREMIRQNYNHPAVCFWGCGNENLDEGQAFVQGMTQYGPMSERLIQALNSLAKAEDPDRLTTYASFHSEQEISFALPGQKPVHYSADPQRFYTDLTAFNKYFGWYYGEPSDTATFFDGIHAKYPTKSIGVSEYGAGGSIKQHAVLPVNAPRVEMNSRRANAFAKYHPEEYQAYYHEEAWKVLNARPYIWVKFVWTMFDFASDFRDEGDTPGRNDKGLVTYDRKTRKDAFYFYKASWSDEPVLYIAQRRMTERSEATTEVKVYSNAPSAELFVNGKSAGVQSTAENHIFRWPGVTLSPGANSIRVAAQAGAKALSDECSWTYTAKVTK